MYWLIKIKKKLDDNRAQFSDRMQKRAGRFAIQEIKVIVEKDKEVQNTLLDSKSMDPTAFASLLLEKYRNQLFPILDQDTEEWLGKVDNGNLESLLEQEVVPNDANKDKEEMGLRVKKVVFNQI